MSELEGSSRAAARPTGVSLRRVLAEAGLLALIGLIGWVDWLTGADLSLALLYLVPIVAAGWYRGSRSALVHAAGASIAWFLADITLQSSDLFAISVWNSFTRLCIFVALGQIMARVRADQLRLGKLLARETSVSRTDPITGLANSRAFMEALAACAGEVVGLLYLDLDNFKRVNDLLGHAAGDALLREVAEALRGSVRATDVTARLGGDEFGVVLPGADAAALQAIGERLVEQIAAIGARYPGTGLGVSVGYCCFERAPGDVDAMLRAVDQAMYRAKTAGKGRVVGEAVEAKTGEAR